jgi:hypothetical protein
MYKPCRKISTLAALIFSAGSAIAAPGTYTGPIKAVWLRAEGAYLVMPAPDNTITCTAKTAFFVSKDEPIFKTYVNQANLAMTQGHNVSMFADYAVCGGSGNGFTKLVGLDHVQP